MPTTPMLRVRTVVTGVAGSPYYITGYFSQADSIVESVVDAWHDFVCGDSAFLLIGTTYTTEGEVAVVDPGTGETLGFETTPAITNPGSNDYPLGPRAAQLLVRWRTGVYFGGREIRGRTSLPLVSEDSSNASGSVSSSTVSGINTRASLMLERSGVEHVVWSKSNGQWQPTQLGSCWDQFSVLRSRRD